MSKAAWAAIALIHSSIALSQPVLSKAKRECWDRHPGQVEYVKCIASTMERIDPAKREWYGEVYGAKEYLECALTRPGDSYCERHRLRRRLNPEYWPNSKAVAINWPEAPREGVYRRGMKPKEYFDALCKAEAGEFIYKVVDNVDGIYQIRPRLIAAAYELEDRYVMEDPYGYSPGDSTQPEDYFVQPPLGTYQFLEIPNVRGDHSAPYIRFQRGEHIPGRWAQAFDRMPNGNLRGKILPYIVHKENAVELRSRYGYTWRGIHRPHDRDNSIAGGELAVVDLLTGEILGLRRGFSSTRNKEFGNADWEAAASCSPKLVGLWGHLFVKQILRPVRK